MQLDRARRVFASHMAAARTRKLTAYEKAELTRARQALRRARRPAGLSKVNPSVKGPFSVYVFKPGRGMVFIGSRSSLTKAKDIARQEGRNGYEIFGRGGVQVARQAVKAPYTPLHPSRNRRGVKSRKRGATQRKVPRTNPGGLIRMGKLVELRYQRDHGKQPGFYKHEFSVRPTIYYRKSDNSIWIKGGR